jgi:CHAT domain-containing protein/Tfp pilus assembly protein PilF
VITRRFRAILFQSLCLALNLVWLAQAIGQPYAIPNSAEAKSEADQLLEKANELYLKKDYDAVLPLLDRCLSLKENALGRDDPQVADLLLMIGGVYREKGDSARALPYLQHSLSIKEKVLGKDSTAVVPVLFWLGFLHSKLGEFDRAAPYIERSLKLVSPLPDNAENLQMKADLYWGLGLVYSARVELNQAIQAFNESLKLKEKLVGADDSSLVKPLIEIAQLHSGQGRPTDGIPLLERALAISEKKFGPESAEAAIALASLGNTRAQAGQVEPALASLKRSLQIREKLSPPTSPDLGTTTSNLGSIYLGIGDYGKAMPLLERSVALLEKSYVPHDAVSVGQFASALNSLGTAQLSIGEYAKAISTLQRSIAVNELAFGSASINLVAPLKSLAGAYRTRGDVDRAQPLLERALRILEVAPSFMNSVRVDTLNDLAWMLLGIGDEDGALKLFNQARDLGEKQLGATGVPFAFSLNGLALINERRGNIAGAFALSERSLAILEKTLGQSDPSLAAALSNVSELVERNGDADRARSMLQKALAIEQKALPPNHPNIGNTLDRLATLSYRRRDYKEAQDLWRKSIAIADSAASNSPDTCIRLGGLGSAEIFNGDVPNGVAEFVEAWKRLRRYIAGQTAFQQGSSAASLWKQEQFGRDWFNSLCELAPLANSQPAARSGAEQLAFGKALLEEIETTKAKLTTQGRTQVQALRDQADSARMRLLAIPKPEGAGWLKLQTNWQNSQHEKLEAELKGIEEKLVSASELVSRTISESELSLAEIARSLPPNAALIDFVQYRRYDTQWKEQHYQGVGSRFIAYAPYEQRYAAYLTFPLESDSQNVVVERVDLGEAAPIDDAVGTIAKRFAAGRDRAKDLQPAFQHLSNLVYAPLAKHLINVSHLIICPDGQLSRLPFEMLPVDSKFLVEEKTISYVTSGREVVRLASSKSNVQSSKSLVMGNPDFDFDLKSFTEKRVTQVPHSNEKAREESETSVAHSSENRLAVTRSLSRDYRGLKFPPLPGAEAEAESVANLLGGDSVLRLGAEAREAELKAVQSPRVLDLATHGFFLSDQEFSPTNSGSANLLDGLLAVLGAPQRVSTTKTDWENPLLRCGLALAGANHTRQIQNAVAEDGLVTGLEASLLNLHGTEVVILSACDSSSGEIKNGEGVMSLQRAFRIAGAETVLASHWKVSDKATTQLMTEFMRRWREGESRANAWREAQLTLLHSKDFSNPFFWSAFTLTGQWR